MSETREQGFEGVLHIFVGGPREKARRLGIASVVSKNFVRVLDERLPQEKPRCVNGLGKEQGGPLFLNSMEVLPDGVELLGSLAFEDVGERRAPLVVGKAWHLRLGINP